jgi:hypothetical protein
MSLLIYMYDLDSAILIVGSFIYDPNHDGFLGKLWATSASRALPCPVCSG